MVDFNPNKHFLGNLCRNFHEYQDTGKSVRYVKGKEKKSCVECKRLKTIRLKQSRFSLNLPPNLDKNRFYLGVLCKRSHEFEDTKQTLRYIRSGACVDCYPERTKTDAAYKAMTLEAAKRFYYSEKGQIYYAEYRKSELRRIILKKWNSSEKKRIVSHRYLKTDKAKVLYIKIAAKRRQCLKNGHSFNYADIEVKQRYQDFNNCCAYCGAIATSIDHVIPISKGGVDVLGNLLPCCRSCNSSKGTKDIEFWYRASPNFTPARWKRILKVLGLTERTLGQIPLF